MADLIDIEGIGPQYAAKLEAAGLSTTESLLEQAGSPSGRDALAERSGINKGLLLKWVNHADLYRITGIGGQYSELLEASGVDSVLELAHRNGPNLTTKLTEVNDSKHLVRRVPTQGEVEGWIEEAKTLPRAVSH